MTVFTQGTTPPASSPTHPKPSCTLFFSLTLQNVMRGAGKRDLPAAISLYFAGVASHLLALHYVMSPNVFHLLCVLG